MVGSVNADLERRVCGEWGFMDISLVALGRASMKFDLRRLWLREF